MFKVCHFYTCFVGHFSTLPSMVQRRQMAEENVTFLQGYSAMPPKRNFLAANLR